MILKCHNARQERRNIFYDQSKKQNSFVYPGKCLKLGDVLIMDNQFNGMYCFIDCGLMSDCKPGSMFFVELLILNTTWVYDFSTISSNFLLEFVNSLKHSLVKFQEHCVDLPHLSFNAAM